MPLDITLDAFYHQFFSVVKLLTVRVQLTVTVNLIQQASKAQFNADVIVAGAVGFIVDPGNQAVQLLFRD